MHEVIASAHPYVYLSHIVIFGSLWNLVLFPFYGFVHIKHLCLNTLISIFYLFWVITISTSLIYTSQPVVGSRILMRINVCDIVIMVKKEVILELPTPLDTRVLRAGLVARTVAEKVDMVLCRSLYAAPTFEIEISTLHMGRQ